MGNQPSTGASAEAEQCNRDLVVVSHNIAGHWFSTNDPPRLYQRLAAFADELERVGADLVLVQELYSFSLLVGTWSRELNWFHRRMRHAGFRYSTLDGKDESTRWVGMDAGLRVWSKLPILSSAVAAFPTAAPYPGASYKAYQVARIKWMGGTLGVVNVHCSFKPHEQPEQQWRLVADLSEQMAAEQDNAVLVAGDFNDQLPPKLFSKRFECLGPVGVCTHDHGLQLDHVFASAGCARGEARVADWRTEDGMRISDHRGLVLSLLPQ
eukprot:TRINITY_DN11412_c0_g1_i1.p1 TRINITY_DN11412_c0_g1~~TRINITY_DN11412_c0_g1_i1.p1  ORF type:complete len:267 (-),score=50.18 TRINITY_DN11412_c0_g1_i1:298-1098(-)